MTLRCRARTGTPSDPTGIAQFRCVLEHGHKEEHHRAYADHTPIEWTEQ